MRPNEWPIAGGAVLCVPGAPHHNPQPGTKAPKKVVGGSPRLPGACLFLSKAFHRNAPACLGRGSVCPITPRRFRLLPNSRSWRLGRPALNFIQDQCGVLSCCRSPEAAHILCRCLKNNTFLFKIKSKSWGEKETCIPLEDACGATHPLSCSVRVSGSTSQLG